MGGGFCSREWAFRRVSKSLFGNIVWLSFMWLLVTYSAYRWKKKYHHVFDMIHVPVMSLYYILRVIQELCSIM